MRLNALLLASTLLFAVLAGLWGPWDQPAGLDVWPAMGNARALWTGDWEAWHPWRWPLHSVLVGAGPLLPTAHAVSIASIAGAGLFAGWRARQLAGPVAGLMATLVVLASPDMTVFARLCTAYPLLALLLTASLVRGRLQPVALLLLGLVDARGAVLGLAALAGLGLERQWRGLALGALGLGLGSALPWLMPVDLVPLWTQADLQHHSHPETLWDNLRRGLPYVPLACIPLGVALLAGLRRSSLAALGTMLLGGVGLFSVAQGHRYLLPLLPGAAVLIAVGLSRLPRPWMGWTPLAVALLGWQLHPRGLRQRPPQATALTQALRAIDAGPDEAVLDCVRGHAALRMSGVEVRENGCERALRNGGPGLWLITRSDKRFSSRWTEVGRWPEQPGREIVLLHGER